MGFFGLKIYLKAKKIEKIRWLFKPLSYRHFQLSTKYGIFKFICSTIFQAPFKQYNMEMR